MVLPQQSKSSDSPVLKLSPVLHSQMAVWVIFLSPVTCISFYKSHYMSGFQTPVVHVHRSLFFTVPSFLLDACAFFKNQSLTTIFRMSPMNIRAPYPPIKDVKNRPGLLDGGVFLTISHCPFFKLWVWNSLEKKKIKLKP